MECPACHAEMGPNDGQCPICLRPRSRRELMESLNKDRRDEDARRRKPYQILGAIVLVLALGYGFKQAQRMGFLKSAPPPEPPKPQAAAPAPAPAPSIPSIMANQATSTPAPAVTPAYNGPKSSTAAAPAEEAPADWLVNGAVYDLISLKPAAGARLVFENHFSGEQFKAKCDARGRYKVHLPKLTDGGYAVSVSAKGYRGDYLEEGSPPFANRTQAGREEAAADAAQSAVLHVPIFLDKDAELEYNLALLPHE